jgi:hypothetical protein
MPSLSVFLCRNGLPLPFLSAYHSRQRSQKHLMIPPRQAVYWLRGGRRKKEKTMINGRFPLQGAPATALALFLSGLAAAAQPVRAADHEYGAEAAARSLKEFTVAPGLEVTLFASEPLVRNPTDMDIDERGRVWVTEGVN